MLKSSKYCIWFHAKNRAFIAKSQALISLQGSCSKERGGHGGWWFDGRDGPHCGRANLNGYNYASGNATKGGNGIYWHKVTGWMGSLKSATMSISPINV